MCPKLIELLFWNGPTVHVWCFMLARASTKTFFIRIHIRQPSPKKKQRKKSQLTEKFLIRVTRQPRYHCIVKVINRYQYILIFFPKGQQPLVGQGRLTLEATRSHSNSRRLVTQTSVLHHSQQTQTPPGGIRTYNHSNRADADPSLRPRGHYNWLKYINKYLHIYVLKHLSPKLCTSYTELFVLLLPCLSVGVITRLFLELVALTVSRFA